ncbi:MAG: hypothetical protein AB7S68_18850, partial [Polyangiaceae bacterium]
CGSHASDLVLEWLGSACEMPIPSPRLKIPMGTTLARAGDRAISAGETSCLTPYPAGTTTGRVVLCRGNRWVELGVA